MDLTKMFFNAFTGSSELNLRSVSAKKQSSGNFESYLNKAGDSDKTKNVKTKNTTENKKASKSADNKAVNGSDSKAENKNDVKNPKQNADKNNSKTDADKTSDKNKISQNKSEKTSDKSVNTEKIDNTEDINVEIVEEISAATGLTIDEINAVLQSLNMAAADLINPDNLLKFMTALTGVENAIDLISVDGVKDIMTEIKNVFEESDKFKEFAEKTVLQQTGDNQNAEADTNLTGTVKTDENNVLVPEVQTTENNVDNTQVLPAEKGIDVSFSFENVKNEKANIIEDKFISQEADNTESLNSVVPAMENADTNAENFSGSQSFLLKENNLINQEEDLPNTVIDNITNALNNAMTRTEGNNTIIRTEAAGFVDTAEVVQQIIDKVKVGINKDVSELKISLKPEELGDVTVKIASHNGIVTAQITAESQRIKEIIEAGFNQLKQALSDAGVEVSQLEVNVSSDQNEGFENQYGANNDKSSSRINQIIDQSEEENEVNYVKENEVVGANVNYMA